VSFPIKYLENNLVFNKNGDVYCYYEWDAYNYSFVSDDKAKSTFQAFQALVAESQAKKFEFFSLGLKESIHDAIERSKKLVKGELKELAYSHFDGIEEQLINYHGDYEVGYKFFVGFQLSKNDDEFSSKTFLTDFKNGLFDFKNSVNKVVFDDYIVMSNKEIERYIKLEEMLYHRISKRFKLTKTNVDDMAYIIEHLNGQEKNARTDYNFPLDVKVFDEETHVNSYDILRLNKAFIDERERYIKITTDEKISYAGYLSVSNIVAELEYPHGSEVFYHQQATFDFPVDTSVKIERIDNKSSLSLLRAKKLELKDLDESALESGNDSSLNLIEARDDASDLEAVLERSKDDMYKMSFVVRVLADSKEDLFKRINEVRDFYRSYNMLIERPLGDQLGLYEEFYPSNPRFMNDYVQYVGADFLASLGFGATQELGEKEGIYLGYNVDTGKSVYIQPSLSAQGVNGSNTNALAKAIIGSLGGGKSVLENLMTYYSVLMGAVAFLIDPKGERINWREDLSILEDNLNVIDITANEENRGLLDPFLTMKNVKDGERLALDTLTFLTGINSRDSERFPKLRQAVKKVAEYEENRGMLAVIEELKNMEDSEATSIATHIESFTDLSIAMLMFSDGTARNSLSTNSKLNVALLQDLILPDSDSEIQNYSPIEMLSISIMIILANYSLQLIKSDRSIFKVIGIEEAWSWLQVNEGKVVANKLVREGRRQNAASDFTTQNTDDLLDEKMKNNIGMKFAFRSTDSVEIEKTLRFFNLEHTEANENRIRGLQNGECLFQDIYGNCGILCIDYVFDDLFKAFDTRPPVLESEV
jgi:hypothetical protein